MTATLILRFGLGLVLLIFGFDQLRSYRPWVAYVPRWLRWVELPTERMFWRSHAMLNILLAVALFYGAYLQWISLLVTVWLGTITLVTFFSDWQTSVRDFGLTAAALALWLLV